MPVVVNEFEVVTEPGPPPVPTAPAGTNAPVMTPPDLERLLARHNERAARVRAY